MFDPTWEPEIATIIAQKHKEGNQNIKCPIMAAIVGMPGSGKTTTKLVRTNKKTTHAHDTLVAQ